MDREPCLTVNVDVVIVEDVIGSLNCATITTLAETPMAPGAGVSETSVGA